VDNLGLVVDLVDPLEHSDRVDHDRIPMDQIPMDRIPMDPYHIFSFSSSSFYQMVDNREDREDREGHVVRVVRVVRVGHVDHEVVVDHVDPLDYKSLKR
jgi:hypothetical protein